MRGPKSPYFLNEHVDFCANDDFAPTLEAVALGAFWVFWSDSRMLGIVVVSFPSFGPFEDSLHGSGVRWAAPVVDTTSCFLPTWATDSSLPSVSLPVSVLGFAIKRSWTTPILFCQKPPRNETTKHRFSVRFLSSLGEKTCAPSQTEGVLCISLG